MASKTPTEGTLTDIYANRIGNPSTGDEARGYWLFVLGLLLGFVGIGWLVTSNLTESVPRGPVVIVGLGLVLLIAGPTIRLPLQRWATWLVYSGAVLSLVGVAWFVTVYPGWRPEAQGVIGLYALGLLVIAVGGAFVPVLTAREGDEAEDSALQAELDELRETISDSERNEAELADRIASLQTSLAESERRNAELEDEVARSQDDVENAEADEADLAAVINEDHASQAQFELYEDQDGEWRWRLRHRNGNVIADGNQGYAREHDAQQGIRAVRRDALGASLLRIENEANLPEDEAGHGFIFADEVESKATFELYADEGDEYRWRLRHDNGNIIADGREGYASRDGAESAIEGIRAYVGPAEYLQPDPTAIEVYEDEAGEYRWRLRHRNGNILASSGEGYANRASARRAIDRIRDGIDDTEIEVYEDEDAGFRWRLAGGDDKIKLDSGSYESREGATDAVERVREFMPNADLLDIGQAAFEVYEDEGGEHRWRLRHRNGNILAGDGQGYADKSSMFDSIESMKRNAPNAGFEGVDG